MIQGSLKDDKSKLSVAAIRLEGKEITISVADTVGGRRVLMELEGFVKGDTIEGTALVTDAQHPLPTGYSWRAVRTSK